MLSPAQAFQAIREHVEAIVWSLFAWEEGDVTFNIGALDTRELVRIQIPLRQVVVQGVKRAANAKSLVTRMGGKETLFGPFYKAEELIDVALDADEYKLLDPGRRQADALRAGDQGPARAAGQCPAALRL